MSLRINLNAAALTAHRMLTGTDTSLGKSIERLSSGFKINSAADDPAGLVISEKLRAQVSGLGQAIRNAGDATNMVKTAEGALNEVSKLLRSMRDLAVHAANTGATDEASVAADQAQIRSAIESINKIGTETQFGNKKLLDGSAGLATTITGSSVVAADLSMAPITTNLTGVTVTTTQQATQATLTGTADITGSMALNTITINGVKITGGANQAATVNAINAHTNETGVVASASGNFLKLDQQAYGSGARIDVTGGFAIFGSVTATAAGNDVWATVQNGTANVSDITWDSGQGTTLRDSLGNSIQLTTAAAIAAPAALGAQLDVAAGTLVFQIGAYVNQTRSMNLASINCSRLGIGNESAGAVASLADVDVTKKPTEAIMVLDKAITDISSQRANLGAIQRNVLESSINSLTIAKENIAASESTIRDTDMASEMIEFTRNQILEQAGTAMLAQANQAPQALLSLLK